MNGTTGMLDMLQVNNQNVLISPMELISFGGMGLSSSRIHLHSAPTDNHRNGYLSSWKACGVDEELEYSINKVNDVFHSYESISYNTFEDVKGKKMMKFIRVERLPESHELLQSSTGSQGIRCSWTMIPRRVDIAKLRLLKEVNFFLEDSIETVAYIHVRNSYEETTLHHVCYLVYIIVIVS